LPKNRQMQMINNHGHKNIVTYPTGVTIKNGKTPQSTENHLIFSAFFVFTHLPVLRKILKRRVCKKALRLIGV